MLGFIIFLVYAAFFVPLCILIVKSIKEDEARPWPEWRRSLFIAFGGSVLLTIILITLTIYTEVLWFNKLTFVSVYWTRFFAKWILFIGSTIIAAIILFSVTGSARRIATPLPKDYEPSHYENWFARTKGVKISRSISIWVVAMLMALWPVVQWEKVLLYLNQFALGKTDPIFGKDVSFYLFSYPIYTEILRWFFVLFSIAGIGLVCLYLFYYARTDNVLVSAEKEKYVSKIIRSALLNSIPFLVLGFLSTWRAIYALMFSGRGVVFGASYTDVHVQIGAYKLFMFLIIVAVVIMIIGAIKKSWKVGVWSWSGFIVSWLLVVIIYPAIIQGIKVRPSELDKETPYIKHNIKFTRQAFDLEKVKEKPLTAANDLTWSNVTNAKETIDNIRLWDWRALQSSFKQIQEIRLYYEFTDVDVDRYNVNGQYRQVMLSAREMVTDQIPERSRTWINKHFKYTHGYGLCLNLVNEFSREGLPNLIVKNIPPVSSAPEIQINRPEIYYGESTYGHVFVKTSTEEFDYPQGDENVSVIYQGDGGVEIGSGIRKLAFAVKFDGIKILMSQYLKPDSRIMFHRQIQERLKTIAPFLIYDDDPYMVVVNGKLYWINDAFTALSNYPYSERHDSGINYIRNSVKAVVDAFTGKVTYYVFDDEDVIIKTWQKIFPALFTARSEMSKELLRHVRYPEDMLEIQGEMYGTYHMLDPEVFYNREDVWVRANEIYSDTSQVVEPYFIIMKLPGEEKEEFIQILPFTPRSKDNMIGWMASRSDGDKYGEILVYKLPKEKYVAGPKQVEAKIDQHDEMSKDLSLWKEGGSDVIRGNLLVIPIANSIIYVEPIYLIADNSPIPQLRRVVVAYGEELVWAEDFQSALREIFSLAPVKPTMAVVAVPEGVEEKPMVTNELVNTAQYYYNQYHALMGQGKFQEAGKALEELGKVLNQLNQMK